MNGSTTRFDPARLHEMYGSNAEYVAQFTAAAKAAVAGGFLLEEDAELLIAAAAASGVGEPPAGSPGH
jgi:Alpha/beta hydrolase domain